MSVQLKKIDTNETGPFTKAGRNVAHIMTEPDLGVVDAHNSSLVMEMSVTDSNGDTDTVPLLPWVFAEVQNTAQSGQTLSPAALFRNYRLNSDSLGSLIATRNVCNRVNENINWYKQSTAQQDAKASLFQANANRNVGRDYKTSIPYSPFLVPSRPVVSGVEQTTASQLRTAELRLALHELHPFYQDKYRLPAYGMGRLTHELLLEDVVDVLTVPQMPGEKACQDVNATNLGSAADPATAGSIVPDDGLGSPEEYELDEIPYYVGAPVYVTWTDSGGPQTHNDTIAGLFHNDNATAPALALGIRLANPPAIAGGAATDVTIRIRGVELVAAGTSGNDTDEDYTTSVTRPLWRIERLQLEAHRYLLGPEGLNGIVQSMNNKLLGYYDYTVIDDTVTPTTSYQYTLPSIPQGAFAVAVLMPYNAGTRGLISTRNRVDRYRFAIDGIDTTNRDVVIGASDDANNKTVAAGRGLHLDRLMQFFQALRCPLQRFDSNRWNFLQGHDRQDPGHVILPQLIPSFGDGQNHQLTLNMYSDGANILQTTVHYVFFIRKALRVADNQVTGAVVVE